MHYGWLSLPALDSRIPPLPVGSLNPIEHNIPRRTAPSDLINDNIIILYNQDQQAFQCIHPAKLLIDGEDIFCDNQTLHWIVRYGGTYQMQSKTGGCGVARHRAHVKHKYSAVDYLKATMCNKL